jgi:hypothetical protein
VANSGFSELQDLSQLRKLKSGGAGPALVPLRWPCAGAGGQRPSRSQKPAEPWVCKDTYKRYGCRRTGAQNGSKTILKMGPY